MEVETELDAMEKENFRLLKRFSTKLGTQLGEDIKKHIQKISLKLLQKLHDISTDMIAPENHLLLKNQIIVTTPVDQVFFRTHPKDNVLSGSGPTFCNPTILSNAQIGNKTKNDVVSILKITKPLKLFNFIPISMIFGAQLKEGGNGRGLFSDCCEYSVVLEFCKKNGYDGFIQIDQADIFSFSANDRLPPELHTGTETRTLMNRVALDNIIANEAFAAIDTDINTLVGAIYPEIVLCNVIDNIKIEKSATFENVYNSEKMLRHCTLPNLIPAISIDGAMVAQNPDGMINVNPLLIARHTALNIGDSPIIYALPYLHTRANSVRYSNLFINHLLQIFFDSDGAEERPGGGKRKIKNKARRTKAKKRYGKTLKKTKRK